MPPARATDKAYFRIPRPSLAGPAGFFSRFGLGNVAVPRATAGPLARTGRYVQGVVLDVAPDGARAPGIGELFPADVAVVVGVHLPVALPGPAGTRSRIVI